MENFSAARFFTIAKMLTSLKVYSQHSLDNGDKDLLTPESIEIFSKSLRDIDTDCKKLGLAVSVKTIEYAIILLKPETMFSSLAAAIDHISSNINWEMQGILFFHMPSSRASFYDKKELFGKEVNSKFPGIQFDMVEAGNCYASGRGTACVFHLMRIMEVGVQQFGTKLGVASVTDKNWQNILNEINKAIKVLPPKDRATVAMSQAAANLYSVKLAWRNEVMHPKDTYTLEEAENLIGQVKLFMCQLAVII
jgi:hypothetical protein